MYQKLNSALREIRLLSPTASSEAVTAWRLATFAIETCPPFAALSYLWGDAARNVDVLVDGELLPVTSNLACALKHIECHWQQQFPPRERVQFHLWVDAISVNQNDVREREEQVKLMGDIYSKAEIVIASLGPSNEAIKTSFETLRLVHDQVKDLQDECDVETSMYWLQAYPALIEADAGLPNDQFDANRAWKLLREFLYMQYWRRAWVVQELVLAQKLLFFSEQQSLEADYLFATLRWFKITRQIANDQNLTRPAWLIPSVWSFLTYDNLLGWKAVQRIDWARTEQRDNRMYKLLLSCAGNDLRASDPRDLIYGTMALTRIGLQPDYSPSSSIGELYAKFMAWWFDQVTCLQAEDPDWTLNHLDLLGLAGVGQVEDQDKHKQLTCGLPSWAPNFPLHAHIYSPQIFISQKTADARIFPEAAPIPHVQNLTLSLATIILDEIVTVNTVKETKDTQGLLGFILSYVIRHPVYPNGHPSLQAIFRTFMKDVIRDADPEDPNVMVRFFGFIRAITHGPETGQISTNPAEALDKLGFSVVSEAAFAESFRKVYTSAVTPESLLWVGKWLPLLLQPAWDGKWSDPDILDLCLRTVLEIRELNYTSIAATSKGYLSIAPIGAKPGDFISLMNKSDSASVIRVKGGGYWEHVGRCYSFGLSEYRSEQFTEAMSSYRILRMQ